MIAVRIIAVPERLDRAEALAAATGGTVVLDEKHEGTVFTHQRALRSAGDAEHVVILEDDAVVCGDFVEHVTRLITERPTHLLGLYVGREWPRGPQPAIAEAVARGARWLDDAALTYNLWWGVGYVMPGRDIPAVLEHLTLQSQQAWVNADRRIGSWHAYQGLLSYPLPSPVDHDDDIPSITSQSRRGRVAWDHCRKETP